MQARHRSHSPEYPNDASSRFDGYVDWKECSKPPPTPRLTSKRLTSVSLIHVKNASVLATQDTEPTRSV